MFIIYLFIAAATVVSDQLLKSWIIKSVALGDVWFRIPGLFDFTYVRNTGAAFSILSGKMSFLSILSAVFCVAAIIYWIVKKPKQPLLCTSISLIFAGALSNAIDRISQGFVVDYIETTFMTFPVFNIADCAITIGAVLLVIYVIFIDKDPREEKKK